jgi:NarL family two-component system sensor histidine kinase LiaS
MHQSAFFFSMHPGKRMRALPNSARSNYNNLMAEPRPQKNRFQQLRWRLTLTYTAVTVGALITVELIILVIVGIGVVVFTNSGYIPGLLIEVATAEYAPVLEFYLTQTPPDQEGIATWLQRVGSISSVKLPLSFEATDEMLVVGSDGILLATWPPDLLKGSQIGEPFDDQAVSGLREPLRAALAGDQDPQSLYTVDTAVRKVVLALPIREKSGHKVLGVLIAIGELPTVWSQLGEVLPIVGVSLLFFTLVAGLAGTIYGFLAARGPVQRLDRLSEASLAWSQGDFTMRVEDPAGDELGQLARRLDEMSQQLQELLETRRELAVIEERNRLARDLHDSAKQQAFAAAGQISAAHKLIKIDPEAAEIHIKEAEKLTLALRQELTNLIQQLRPAALEGKGLATALNDYCEGWSRQNAVETDLRIRHQRQLDLEIEQTIFRILQEALANIARHSNANQVEIDLIYKTDHVTCTIRDNGGGFDLENRDGGHGLRSMAERATAIGGDLEIESIRGEGTSISITIPVNGSIKSTVESTDE